MHHARRSVRLKRSGSRSSSSAVKPAPRDLGKWALPQRPDNPPSASNASPPSLPVLGKWATPPPARPAVNGSASRQPSWNKWTRSGGSPQTSNSPASTPSKHGATKVPLRSSTASSRSQASRAEPGFGLSKWNVPPPPARPTSFLREAPPTPSSSRTPPPTHFRREPRPHADDGFRETRRPAIASGTPKPAESTNQPERQAREVYPPLVEVEDGSEPVVLDMRPIPESRVRKTSYISPHKDKSSSRTWGHSEDDAASSKGKEKEKERRKTRSLHLKKIQYGFSGL
ncbi:hypothetical protein PHLGIDRAFT_389570 [Phlebiopsis gigantea 11061_1 CR5-6]|uniref:Uncharacterized protein n=1 Tax=Phlebiopsis gigantea (strain 11061_1 CR5-6) TaxID=745531 RepID=A0A0C3SBP9_PHLG1|nr:hypothetical protein PHLGIDRAFT_389570 [Phlebiopsis gigantea 11061_1 CR5-6]